MKCIALPVDVSVLAGCQDNARGLGMLNIVMFSITIRHKNYMSSR